MNDDKAREVRRKWGTDQEFFKELEDFLKKHRDSQIIEYDTSTNYPICAKYIFLPTRAFKEHEALVMELAEANQNDH
jgi:hypothetical protein